MKKQKLDAASVDEIVERFIGLCAEKDRELLRGDVPRVNELFDDIEAIKQELKSRPGDQRHALISLYRHDNMQVRLEAATATLAIAPEAARRALEDLKASGWMPQAGEASHTFWTLERGIFKPT
ncbi:MAG: DUF2019 domain-containing protein [Alphaproteobacteria bacterium]